MSRGELTFAGCVGENVSGCRDIGPTRPLQSPVGLTVTPDGRSVYVISASLRHGAVSHFRRERNGDIAFAGCIGHGVNGCREIGDTTDSLADPTAVTSLDHSVYVTSRIVRPGGGGVSGGSVAHFRRDPASGDIYHAGCIGRGARSCRDFEQLDALNDPKAVAASPDGASLYVVTAGAGGALIHFWRDVSNGDLILMRGYGAGRDCVNIAVPAALHNPVDVVVTRDGRGVYVVTEGGAVAHFRRDPSTGELSFGSCIGREIEGHAGLWGEDVLVRPVSVAASNDGSSLYVAFSQVAPWLPHAVPRDGVAHFRREHNGDLAYAGCIGRSCEGCSDIWNDSLAGTTAVVASPDDASVYAASNGAVVHFQREPTGDLSFANCVGNVRGTNGHAPSPCAEVPELVRATSIGITADGASVYVASEAGAVSHLRRASS